MVSNAEILNAGILIVDDQEANVQLLADMLQEAGYLHITTTTNPHAVAALHGAHRYDLILLDLQMPGMDGFEVMEGLKHTSVDGYLPVLVITAQPSHKLRALSCGARDFVAKPFDLIEVKTRIRNMLETRLLYKKLESYSKTLEQTVLERTAELRESEARFRRLTELAADWHWEQDANGNFTNTHGPVLEMIGIPAEGVSGAHQPEQAARWDAAERAALTQTIAERQPFLDFVFSQKNDDGTKQYFQVSGEPMFDSAGGFTGYRGVGREITEIMRDRVRPKSTISAG